MFPLSVTDFFLTIAAGLFIIGVLSIGIGIFILVTRVLSEDLRTLAQQASKLAQKGIAEDVAGLVGNASSLVDAMTSLVKTTSGIGIFLVVVGSGFISAAYFILTQVR